MFLYNTEKGVVKRGRGGGSGRRPARSREDLCDDADDTWGVRVVLGLLILSLFLSALSVFFFRGGGVGEEGSLGEHVVVDKGWSVAPDPVPGSCVMCSGRLFIEHVTLVLLCVCLTPTTHSCFRRGRCYIFYNKYFSRPVPPPGAGAPV